LTENLEEALGYRLSREYILAPKLTGEPRLAHQLDRQEQQLSKAYQWFSDATQVDIAPSSAAEWLLDNFFVVQQAIREIREDMPAGYYKQLPMLANSKWASYPRIYALACESIDDSNCQVDLADTSRMINAFQSGGDSLTMGELWALPTMLRLGILNNLSRALTGFNRADEPSSTSATSEADDSIVSACITSLRVLAMQDWNSFFESVSNVEQVLRLDSAGIYSSMDFDTRDSYRKVIERVARLTRQPEKDVAQQAIALTASAQPSTRMAHVGYYLLDVGRHTLEDRLQYHPSRRIAFSRWLISHRLLAYLGSIAFVNCILVAVCISLAIILGATPAQVVGVGCLTILPFAMVAGYLVNWIITHRVSPRALPRMDYRHGIPVEHKAIVVIPTLLTSIEDIDSLLLHLEQHFLRNADPHLYYALLSDLDDAPRQHMPDDAVLVNHAKVGIIALNEKHALNSPPFLLFHRGRQWNPLQNCWMGWERKRGKLIEFNRVLRGDVTTSFHVKVGDLEVLPSIQYVITLDADTILPEDGARRLVATIAHPLNRAEYDSVSGKVLAGYGVLQPRIEITPISANQSRFTRTFSGDVGLDLYTRAVSDVYQDLFGEGTFVGKGIYAVDVFAATVADSAPENTLLSHDLFEGLHAHAALVTDIVLFEEFPAQYLAHTRRLHRWIRGDWQLLPWLAPRVPTGEPGVKSPNSLSVLDRWKILDNLRRSLVSPAVIALLVAAWTGLLGTPLLWTLVGLGSVGVSLVLSALTDLRFRQSQRTLIDAVRPMRLELWRWLLAISFLPYEAFVALHAIVSTLVRLFATRKRLLTWTTSAQTARLYRTTYSSENTWREMIAAPSLAALLFLVVAVVNWSAIAIASPLLLLWFISPQIAYRISRPKVWQEPRLSPDQETALRHLARQTWLFFEQMVGPEDHWLPPDHYQEAPRVIVAHRTSPTNIGLYLLSVVAAHDLGYIGITDVVARLQAAFDTVGKLERHRGHLLNWYNTQNLEPLSPRYVSSVDSGNLAGCLVAIKQACLGFMEADAVSSHRWQGLLDTLGLLEDSLKNLHASSSNAPIKALYANIATLARRIQNDLSTPECWASLAQWLNVEAWADISRLIVAVLESESPSPNVETLSNLRVASERFHYHMTGIQRDLELFLPWLAPLNSPPSLFSRLEGTSDLASAWTDLTVAIPVTPRMGDLLAVLSKTCANVDRLQNQLRKGGGSPDQLQDARTWCEDFRDRLNAGKVQVQALLTTYSNLVAQAQTLFQTMEFGFLFNAERGLFHIGYNTESGSLDENCYDLLASEARLGSLLAIAKRDVPVSHWLRLGRPITSLAGVRTLLSWSGSMFEYLMPTLLMQSYDHTLLAQSCEAAIDHQIAYGREKETPWGISESSYYAFDANLTYQYRAFGVPGLGLKRGLMEDLVIAPYASVLALRIRPQAVRQNMDQLDELGMRGQLGFYEAVDFSRARLSLHQSYALVRSYMAHHQGMIMLSLTNYLQRGLMVERFHADPIVQSVELLLQERIPNEAPLEYPHHQDATVRVKSDAHVTIAPWSVPTDTPSPQAHVLSNGSLSTLITDTGGGFTNWRGLNLIGSQSDDSRDNAGTWVYVQDQITGDVWSAGYQPSNVAADSKQTLFFAHQVEFQRRDHDIGLQMNITVASEDVEIRRVSLINHSDQSRHLQLVSYGEVHLAAQNEQHPAFNKLFIESEHVPESNLLLFHRRPRTGDEEPVYLGHLMVTDSDETPGTTFDGDRLRFLGRGMTARRPAALQKGGPGLTEHVGIALDPIMSLGLELVLEPHATAHVAILTVVAGSRAQALTLANRYSSWSAIASAFDSASRQSELALRELKLDTAQLALIERMLSALLYSNTGLRASADVIASNVKGQAGLWAYGISGDLPILLACIHDASELSFLYDLLRAHAYWRSQQLRIDLVILNLQDSNYSQDLHSQILRLIVRANSGTWLNQHGGIFTLHADQMSEVDRVLLLTTARVVLDGREGSLAQQLARVPSPLPPLPLLNATRSPSVELEVTPPLDRPRNLRFDNGWGGFSADGKEYVIYLKPGQWTPAPWVNVIANETFGTLVSETGSAYTWAENSSQNRLTPWSNDPVTDVSGECLYLRDEETAHVWSPSPLPSRDAEPYVVRHGAGYSSFQHHSQGLKQDMVAFVAPNSPIKIIKLRLENLWQRPRRITVTYYAEWVLGVTYLASQPYIVTQYDHASGALLARNTYNTEFGDRTAFLAANKAPHGVTSDRAEFLGRLGDLSHPDALSRIGLSSRVESGDDPCAAMQLHIDLPIGGSEEIYFLLGEGKDKEQALHLIQQFQDPAQVEATWLETHTFWDNILGAVTVHTPEPVIDIMVNRWLLYQALSCRIWGRTGFYQSSGAFGYRDQLQDVMALTLTAPTIAHDHILRAARHQFEAGDVLHWWHPPSGRGVRTRISDDLLWLPFVVAHYIETTGDLDILREEAPFLRGEALKSGEEERYAQFETTRDVYTLYEHCLRAIKHGSTSGSHGLPLMGTGDWNDGMNRVGAEGRGESVWVGWFLYSVLTRIAPLCERMDDANQANLYREQAQRLKAALDTEAWDGQWYRRAFFDDGTPLGAASNLECQIDSIAQSWAVLSGAGDPDRMALAMAAVAERLIDTSNQLILLLTPPFDKTLHNPGYIKGYPPGLRENGGQYTHAAVWTAWAFIRLGQGDRAFDLFRMLIPIAHSDDYAKAERYRVEPYVAAADVYSADKHIGQGGWTWYTGSASWMYRLGIEGLLGLKRSGDHLVVDPCIPNHWTSYEMTCRDGETEYAIQVRNPERVARGVIETRVDGTVISPGPIPLLRDGGKHDIQVLLGNVAS
jgi:cyclic beta-1,2-glucan synthetase